MLLIHVINNETISEQNFDTNLNIDNTIFTKYINESAKLSGNTYSWIDNIPINTDFSIPITYIKDIIDYCLSKFVLLLNLCTEYSLSNEYILMGLLIFILLEKYTILLALANMSINNISFYSANPTNQQNSIIFYNVYSYLNL